jgi:hypothetical protein
VRSPYFDGDSEQLRRQRAHESDSGSNFSIAFGPARERRKALLTATAGATKKAVKAAPEKIGCGAAAWRSGRSAADPKQPLRFMTRQARVG